METVSWDEWFAAVRVPARVCANESKKHVAGQKGTPFSQCVSAAAKLQGDQNGGSDQGSTGS